MKRLATRFAALKAQGRTAFIPYMMAFDQGEALSLELLQQLPKHGADIIELGMPFSDPMADGPAIQDAASRALKAGATTDGLLSMVATFRQEDRDTPIILMGYYNPIYHYGVDDFVKKAAACGVDGLLIVDVPPEEDAELWHATQTHDLALIRLVTPTTDLARFELINNHASGFLYYVSITGVTGTDTPEISKVIQTLHQFKPHTNLPIAVGFGLQTTEDVQAFASHSDAVVVGSVLVRTFAEQGLEATLSLVSKMAAAL